MSTDDKAPTTIPREWVGYPEMDSNNLLPPDPMWFAGAPFCEARDRSDTYTCTRIPGHTGRHAASNGELIVAVWS